MNVTFLKCFSLLLDFQSSWEPIFENRDIACWNILLFAFLKPDSAHCICGNCDNISKTLFGFPRLITKQETGSLRKKTISPLVSLCYLPLSSHLPAMEKSPLCVCLCVCLQTGARGIMTECMCALLNVKEVCR